MKIGIDLGGSHVGIGVVDSDYNLVYKSEENFTESEKENLETELIKKINQNMINVLENLKLEISDIEHIGIACPGTVKDGTIIKARKPWNLQFPNS